MLSGIEAHQLGSHGIDGHLVRRGQDDVLDQRLHHARTGAISGGGAIHDGQDPGMDFLLDGQQVHQRFVDPGVGVMAVFAQQTPKSILHRPGGGGVHVGLDRRQVDDILTDEVIRDADAFRIDVIQEPASWLWADKAPRSYPPCGSYSAPADRNAGRLARNRSGLRL